MIANGTMTCRAMEAATMLGSDGLRAAVLNLPSVRPLDLAAIKEAAARGPIITIGEHTAYGWRPANKPKRCAELFRAHRDRIDGVLLALPNFGDERVSPTR